MRINWYTFGLAMFFSVVETNYFGWNMTPQSEAELICDGITLLLFALSFGPAYRRD